MGVVPRSRVASSQRTRTTGPGLHGRPGGNYDGFAGLDSFGRLSAHDSCVVSDNQTSQTCLTIVRCTLPTTGTKRPAAVALNEHGGPTQDRYTTAGRWAPIQGPSEGSCRGEGWELQWPCVIVVVGDGACACTCVCAYVCMCVCACVCVRAWCYAGGREGSCACVVMYATVRDGAYARCEGPHWLWKQTDSGLTTWLYGIMCVTPDFLRNVNFYR